LNGNPSNPRSDATKMTKEVWESNGCNVVDWTMILVEFAVAGVRQLGKGGRPATLSVAFGGVGKWENCFANCMVCWRTQRRDFSDASKTPHPYSVSTNSPNQPQLGCCGCVVCNECLLLEFSSVPNHVRLIPCPYCAQLESYSRDYKAWIVCDAVVHEGIPILGL
jgi:hypothetical protein